MPKLKYKLSVYGFGKIVGDLVKFGNIKFSDKLL